MSEAKLDHQTQTQAHPVNNGVAKFENVVQTNLEITDQAEIQELKQLLTLQSAKIRELEQRLITSTPSASNLAKNDTSSRRKMLKRLGLAAASLTAVSLTAPILPGAQAASGDNLIIGNSNLASNTTYLSQTNSTTNLGSGVTNFNPIIWADYNSSAQTSVSNPTSALNAGIAGTSTGGVGGYFQGDRAPILLQPASSAGGRTSGTHVAGELYVENDNSLWYYNGTVWSQLNSASSGTSFPSAPSVGQRFFRTDRNLEYVYTGINNALWQTTEVFSYNFSWRNTQPFTTGGANYGDITLQKVNKYGGAYIEDFEVLVYQVGTINTSNYTSWNFGYNTTSAVSTNLFASGNNNQACTANTWYAPTPGVFGMTAAQQILANNVKIIEFSIVANGTTGNVYHAVTINLRGIG